MDFVMGLPRTQKQYDSIWEVVDRLTKSAHFILVKSTYLLEHYARIFKDEILCRHGIPLSIISDRGAQIHIKVLEVIQKRVGYQGEAKHRFSSPNGWSSGAYY